MATKKDGPVKKTPGNKKVEEQMKDQAANEALSKAAKAANKKGAKDNKEPTAAKRAAPNRTPTVPGDSKITLVRKDNPKRGASAERYKLYKTGMTVDDYVKAGGYRADIKWDMEREFIKVG